MKWTTTVVIRFRRRDFIRSVHSDGRELANNVGVVLMKVYSQCVSGEMSNAGIQLRSPVVAKAVADKSACLMEQANRIMYVKLRQLVINTMTADGLHVRLVTRCRHKPQRLPERKHTKLRRPCRQHCDENHVVIFGMFEKTAINISMRLDLYCCCVVNLNLTRTTSQEVKPLLTLPLEGRPFIAEDRCTHTTLECRSRAQLYFCSMPTGFLKTPHVGYGKIRARRSYG